MKHYYLLFFLFFICTTQWAQDGVLDPSFGEDGIVLTDFDDDYDYVLDVAKDNNGNYIAIGTAQIDGLDTPVIIKYFANGTIDNSFGNNGYVIQETGSNSAIKIINENYFLSGRRTISGTSFRSLVAYNLDGTLDTTFGNDGMILTNTTNDGNSWIFLESEEIIRVDFETTGENTVAKLYKYSPDGSLDNSYGDNGVVQIPLPSSGVEFSSVTFRYGHFYFYGDVSNGESGNSAIYKTDIDGIADSSFGNQGLSFTTNFGSRTNSLDVNSQGAIVVVSAHGFCEEGTSFSTLRRIRANGLLDTSLGTDGLLNLESDEFLPRNIVIQPNGRYLIFGNTTDCFEQAWYTVKRLLPSGEIDTSFSNNGTVSGIAALNGGDFFGSNIKTFDDDTFIILGYDSNFLDDSDFTLTRYNYNPLTVKENPLQNLTIYPNPSTGIFNIKSEFLTENTPFQITDISGKVIKTGILETTETTIDLSNATNGLYFLNAGGTSIKLVKQ